jgi:hypothetical protein
LGDFLKLSAETAAAQLSLRENDKLNASFRTILIYSPEGESACWRVWERRNHSFKTPYSSTIYWPQVIILIKYEIL